MGLIKFYAIQEDGLHPVLVRDSWQVAKLNYKDEYHINNLNRLNIHQKTDRAFALLNGNAVLIAIDNADKKSCFKVVSMQRGTSYNIPKNVGYAIVMEEGSKVFTVERPNTHMDDVKYHPLDEEQLKTIRLNVNKEIKK